MIGSTNRGRMEAALERALRRAGHETLLIDDRRVKRLIGKSLTQRWAVRHASNFRPDFVFLSKCLARFVSMYLLRGGWMDGAPGAVLSALAAASVMAKYARLWALSLTK